MVAVVTPSKIDTFDDAIAIACNRAKIAGTVQQRDLDFIKGAINQHYLQICCERRWRWRRFDRSYIMRKPTTDGTASVTKNARTVTFSDLVVDNTLLGKTFQAVGTNELYRIVGFDEAAQEIFLENGFLGETNVIATYKIYHYEFALPPDCDNVNQLYTDQNFMNNGEIDYLSAPEFNRVLSTSIGRIGPPMIWTEDSQIFANPTLIPLDVLVADYDFLGGEDEDKVNKIRFFPIAPDKDTLIHLSYTLLVDPLSESNQNILIPQDNRWVLIHKALYEWWKTNGNLQMADRENRDGMNILKEMRSEQHKSDAKPKFIVNARRHRRTHSFNDRQDLHLLSRLAEKS